MRRSLIVFVLLLGVFVPAAVVAADDADTTPPTGTVTGSPALVVQTNSATMEIKVSGDDHNGTGIASIHLYVVPAGGEKKLIRVFDPGSSAPQTYTASMTWISGLRDLKQGKYTLRTEIFDVKENMSQATFPFEVVSAQNAPKQKVTLDVKASVGKGLSLKIDPKAPGDVLGKLRVVVHRANKKGKYRVFKKFSQNASEQWALQIPLGKGKYDWQVFFDGTAPYVSTKTGVKRFSV